MKKNKTFQMTLTAVALLGGFFGGFSSRAEVIETQTPTGGRVSVIEAPDPLFLKTRQGYVPRVTIIREETEIFSSPAGSREAVILDDNMETCADKEVRKRSRMHIDRDFSASSLLPQTTAPAINIETPIRCQVPFNPSEIITNIPMDPDQFKLIRMDSVDQMPRYEVNGYTFSNQPLDMALQTLVSEAGIRVYSDDGLFPEISGEDIHGELSAVVNELADAADTYVRYDAKSKKLYLSRWGRFKLMVPGGRVGMYAVLDALRGANITDVQPDFGKSVIYFRINRENQRTITRLIDFLKEDPQLLMFDVKVYRLTDRTNGDFRWKNVIRDFGIKRINMSINGLAGRLLITPHQPKSYTLADELLKDMKVTQISEGVAVMPNTWKVRFDIGQCAGMPVAEKDMSLLLQADLSSSKEIQTKIAIDTARGEISSFNTFYNVDDDLNIVGIPGTVFNPDWTDVEYLITMKPRILRIVK